MRFSVIAVSCLALLAVCSVQAQAPIPYRPDGWQIGAPMGSAPIVLDMFLDLLCPDCAAAWPTIKQVTDFYASNITTTIHTFPLPYHNNGFMMAQAAHTAIDAQPTNAKLPREFADWAFSTQQNYWNGATADSSFNAIQAALGKAAVTAGLVTQAAFDAGMADDNINEEVRVSWKFACSKGVLGTPTFFVNGVFVNGDPSWSLSDWRSVLDPLLQPQPSQEKIAAMSKPKHPKKKGGCMKQRAFHTRRFTLGDCPAGEPVCNYSPGKTECCFAGEMCIPNVGCRC